MNTGTCVDPAAEAAWWYGFTATAGVIGVFLFMIAVVLVLGWIAR